MRHDTPSPDTDTRPSCVLAPPLTADRAPSAPALPDAEELTGRTRALLRLLSPLPDPALLPGERMTLGGSLQPEAPWLVELVAQALEREPALFADVPLAPAALRDEQARALAYRQLRDALALLLRRASDGYTLSQARALGGAMDVLRQVRADAARPFGHPQAAARAEALAPAERLLAGRTTRQRPRGASAAELAPADRRDPSRSDVSPQRHLTDRAARARAHAALDGLALRATQPPERPAARRPPVPPAAPLEALAPILPATPAPPPPVPPAPAAPRGSEEEKH